MFEVDLTPNIIIFIVWSLHVKSLKCLRMVNYVCGAPYKFNHITALNVLVNCTGHNRTHRGEISMTASLSQQEVTITMQLSGLRDYTPVYRFLTLATPNTQARKHIYLHSH